MSRRELAEAVNAYLYNRGVVAWLDAHDIGRYERGETRWPRAHYRRGLRTVLGAETDAQLGLFNTRPSPSNEEPFGADGPGGRPAAETGSQVDGPAVAGPAVAPPPAPPLPGSTRRVVLHWTGRKAYALRIAMRFSVRDFASKLGVAEAVVGQWRDDSTGRLRYETHQMLDTMLSLATDDDLLRFDMALQQWGGPR